MSHYMIRWQLASGPSGLPTQGKSSCPNMKPQALHAAARRRRLGRGPQLAARLMLYVGGWLGARRSLVWNGTLERAARRDLSSSGCRSPSAYTASGGLREGLEFQPDRRRPGPGTEPGPAGGQPAGLLAQHALLQAGA